MQQTIEFTGLGQYHSMKLIKMRTPNAWLAIAMTSAEIYNILAKSGCQPKVSILDNEISLELLAVLEKNKIGL